MDMSDEIDNWIFYAIVPFIVAESRSQDGNASVTIMTRDRLKRDKFVAKTLQVMVWFKYFFWRREMRHRVEL